ncbi:hypothetical protein IFR05_016832 [Cadophora sp. M221]|nr:hypothetical protein IFR05_016832 [Cadophora sp. M221]
MSTAIVNIFSGSRVSISMPTIKKIPRELRMVIFALCMILGPGLPTPACLLALAHDSTLYGEAKHVYRSINYIATATATAVTPFKMVFGNPLDQIKHLTVAFDNLLILYSTKNTGYNSDTLIGPPLNLLRSLAQA